MRRLTFPITIALALMASLLFVGPAGAKTKRGSHDAGATAHRWGTVFFDVTWPGAPVALGSSASATVTLRQVSAPLDVMLYATDGDGTVLDSAPLTTVTATAENPTVTIPLPTTTRGISYYEVLVNNPADVWFNAYSDNNDGEVEVLGTPTTLTATTSNGAYRADAKGKTITGVATGGPRPIQIQARALDGSWVPSPRPLVPPTAPSPWRRRPGG